MKSVADKLKENAYIEEEFISKYNNPSIWALLEASLPKEKLERIKNLFLENIADTKKHSKLLSEMAEKAGNQHD